MDADAVGSPLGRPGALFRHRRNRRPGRLDHSADQQLLRRLQPRACHRYRPALRLPRRRRAGRFARGACARKLPMQISPRRSTKRCGSSPSGITSASSAARSPRSRGICHSPAAERGESSWSSSAGWPTSPAWPSVRCRRRWIGPGCSMRCKASSAAGSRRTRSSWRSTAPFSPTRWRLQAATATRSPVAAGQRGLSA